MVALIPCQVVLEGKYVLIKTIGHRVVLITDVYRTIVITYLGNLDGWEWVTRSTSITNHYIRSTKLIAQHRAEARLELGHDGIGIGLVLIDVVASVQSSDTATTLHRTGVDIAPANRQLIEVVDVPVQLDTCLVAPSAHIGVGIDSIVVITLSLCHILDSVKNLHSQIGIYLRATGTQSIVIGV